jgi:hypothetical protein
MSTVDFDQSWPFDLDGYRANMSRWRRMGRLWIHNGVVQGAGSEFEWRGIDLAGQVCYVGPGVGTIEGFYGEAPGQLRVGTPGNDGMVKLRLDYGAQQVQVFFEAWHAWHDDPWAAHGVMETPLWEVWPDGRVADRRLFVSPDVVTGLETIPDWVPRGHIFHGATGGPTDIPVNSWHYALWFSLSGVTVGRNIRATVDCSAGATPAGAQNTWVHFRAVQGDLVTVVKEVRMWMANSQTPTHMWGEMVFPATDDLYIGTFVGSGSSVRFHNARLNFYDLGRN